MQSLLIAVVPFALATALCISWLFQQIKSDINRYQDQLASAIASQIENYLSSALISVQMAAATQTDETRLGHDFQHLIDSQLAAASSLKAIYALSIDGHVKAIGRPKSQANLKDLLGLDLSKNRLFKQTKTAKAPVWSDTFLSIVSGGLSVALAVSTPDAVVIGEIKLSQLSNYMKRIAAEEKQIIYIIDRRGQVIADRHGRVTAQELNIRNIEIVHQSLKSKSPSYGSFQLNNRTMIGNVTPTPTMGWCVLVAQPEESAFRSVRTALSILTISLGAALIVSVLISFLSSRRLASRFERLTNHARRMTIGQAPAQWPTSNIAEFNELTDNLEQMANAIRENERRLATLMINLPGMAYRCTPDRTRELIFVSQGAADLFDYSSDVLLRKNELNFNRLTHPDDENWVWPRIQEKLVKHAPYLIVYRIVTQAGGYRWVSDSGQGIYDAEGRLVALEGFMTDVSELRAAEEKIIQSEAKYRELFEQSQDTIFISTAEGRYLDINPAGIALLGYNDKENLLALDISKDVYASAEERKRLLEHLKLDGFIKDYEVKLKRKDGLICTVLVTATAIKDKNGELTAIRGIFRNITERKTLEEQLRQAQKMEAIGVLAGGIAHDFNNLLTPILGYADMILQELPPVSAATADLQEIIEASNRAKTLVNQILTFSRQRDHRRHHVQIHHIVKEVLNLLRASIPRSIEIKQNICKCGHILADPGQIHQLVMNLCTNAYHAMRRGGGVLAITTKEIDIDADIYFTNINMTPGRYVQLEISDTGIGMDERVKARIFEPYFTTKKEGEGTGLGLSVVHGIVQDHGGHISVYSDPGVGTSFHVYFPIVMEASRSVKTIDNEEIVGGSERLLIVDDEKPVLKLHARILESLGYHITAVDSSAEALLLFKANPGNFDLVLTDMTMPYMNGAQLAAKLLQIREQVPIILCTGFSDMINRTKAEAIGIRTFVMKPIIRRQMAKIIRQIMDVKSN